MCVGLVSFSRDAKTFLGCLDSLVHFQRLLLQHKEEASVKISSIRRRCEFALTKLETIDPKRKQRYQDIKGQL